MNSSNVGGNKNKEESTEIAHRHSLENYMSSVNNWGVGSNPSSSAC